MLSVDKLLNLVPDRFKSFGGLIGHEMGGTMDIAIKIKCQPAFGQQNTYIFLRGSSAVEIYQWPAVNLVFQDGEELPDFAYIQRHHKTIKVQQSQ
jgi:hypothetical protein